MGWVIRDPRIIWWGGRGGGLDPRGSLIRGPPTTRSPVSECKIVAPRMCKLRQKCSKNMGRSPSDHVVQCPLLREHVGNV